MTALRRQLAGDKHGPLDAGAVMIGDELLSGKVRDANGPYLIDGLRRHGIDLEEIHFVRDDIDAIVEAVDLVRHRRDLCFTSGGIGPTHDDVSMEAVAKAFGMDLELRPALATLIGTYFGDDESGKAWQKMAVVPAGCELLDLATAWPAYSVGNVVMLPGIPQIFTRQVDALLAGLESNPIVTNVAYFRIGEGELARPLGDLAEAFAGAVSFGSYPVIGEFEYQVKVTLDSRDPAALADATRDLLARFPEQVVHAVEEGIANLEGR